MLRPVAVALTVISATSVFAVAPVDNSNQLIISVRDQKLMLVRNGSKVATYPVSTSMFGLGDALGRMTTPLGYLAVEKKIGDNVPVGAVFHKRKLTGEVLQPNTPGRDPITTRIIWLRGLEAQNAHAFQRCIYIHGTPEEKKIGKPASYGCIRMKSKDVAELYDQIPVGAVVQIVPDGLPKAGKMKPRQEMGGGVIAVAANVPPQPAPQKVEPVAENVAPQAPPQKTVAKVAKVTPRSSRPAVATSAANLTQPPSQISVDMLATPPSSSLSVEQMRTAGAIAGARKKGKFAANKRL
ncbi:MAG TPA: L,D-transpeptidase [Candidatus Babeliales bacterium]|nr:L,D-transpeptidase [Candidatus Babeliales bacterium]